MPAKVPDLSPEAIAQALRNPRRRFAIAYLQRQDRPVSLTELGRKTAEWEADAAPDEVDERRSERAKISLHHAHLPKLNDLGLVEYADDEHRTVRATEGAKTIAADLPLEQFVGLDESDDVF